MQCNDDDYDDNDDNDNGDFTLVFFHCSSILKTMSAAAVGKGVEVKMSVMIKAMANQPVLTETCKSKSKAVQVTGSWLRKRAY